MNRGCAHLDVRHYDARAAGYRLGLGLDAGNYFLLPVRQRALVFVLEPHHVAHLVGDVKLGHAAPHLRSLAGCPLRKVLVARNCNHVFHFHAEENYLAPCRAKQTQFGMELGSGH